MCAGAHKGLIVFFLFYRFVIWRRSNKVAIKLSITPDSNLKAGDEVIVGFSMQFTYVNTVSNSPDKKDKKHALTSRVFVTAGKIEN